MTHWTIKVDPSARFCICACVCVHFTPQQTSKTFVILIDLVGILKRFLVNMPIVGGFPFDSNQFVKWFASQWVQIFYGTEVNMTEIEPKPEFGARKPSGSLFALLLENKSTLFKHS